MILQTTLKAAGKRLSSKAIVQHRPLAHTAISVYQIVMCSIRWQQVKLGKEYWYQDKNDLYQAVSGTKDIAQ